ncbi:MULTISPECIES: BlaI/MecI/CopY family transcriptional regulator [Kytococcus]|uniref:BlaI/MecI/CopY family transcriptional regulator n=1 Tax=Kytococcus schroeteri TaxID=138300 RepID=A0A2I1P8V9_9MICO|nr:MULTISPECIES: BlaI/MecI/CopY family transcriptional regulator [Kytococcus]OFS09732.1 CopY family transcriptional regulator [Kytococcus sp. HMSC28H12]PKZ41067.1 BlaI/MecI/CopY family transcriptional regulator [Kytococcus schroeteri]
MSNTASGLGDLEQAIMDHLWDHEAPQPTGFTVRDVHETLGAARDIAYTTVMTVMDRLSRKGFLDRTKQGRAYAYNPATSREGFVARLMSETLGELRPTDRRAAVLAFVDDAGAEDVDALREALARLESAAD